MWTRSLHLLWIALLLFPGLAVAQGKEQDDACLAAVEKLRREVRGRASWNELFATYKEAKAKLDDAKKKVDRDGSSEACLALYRQIRPAVANALRRDRIGWDGWITAFFGAMLLWGGFMACIAIAWKSGKSGTEED